MKILCIVIGYLVIGYVIGCIAEALVDEEREQTVLITCSVLWPLLLAVSVVVVVGSIVAYIPVKIIERVKNANNRFNHKDDTDKSC